MRYESGDEAGSGAVGSVRVPVGADRGDRMADVTKHEDRRAREYEPDGVSRRRRREDALQEMLEHGSRNFRQYRRRASIAFVALTLMSTAGVYWGWESSRAGRSARETQCDREPVSSKVADAAYAVRHALPRESRITKEELARFHRQAPRCP